MDPRIVIDVLVELGQREEELADLRARIARDSRQTRDRRELSHEYEDDAREANESGQQAARDFRQHDRDLHAAETLLADKRDRLVGLSDRRQHRAITEEISALERRIEQLEVAGLTALAAAESSDAEADQARSDARRVDDEAPVVDAAAKQQSADLAVELEQEISRLTGMLPPDAGRHVQRLRQRGDRAVAWVNEGTCTGCFAQMPAQHGIAAAKGRQLVRCASCARFVVHRPWR
ncbi:hypothetical protein DRQ50_07420 [bacterium]|nr:MAG: hypothetical protein DRQ50_07420 [bacterium]